MRTSKKAIIGVAGTIMAVAIVAVLAFWHPWSSVSEESNAKTAVDGEQTSFDEAQSENAEEYVGSNGEGSLNPDDYETDEDYQRALIESGQPAFEVPHELVSEKQEGESYDHGYEKYLVDVYFFTSFGEERAREIVGEVGGVWVDDTFAWPRCQESGRVSVTTYFEDADTREELDSIAEQFQSYDEVKQASAATWFESS